jgi:hypothetical protein
MDNELFDRLINLGFNPRFKSTVNVAGYPYFGTGLDTSQDDHISITIALDSDYIIRRAWWDGRSSLVSQGIADYICEVIVGTTVKDASQRSWPEFVAWKHRGCTGHPINALKRACLAAIETTPAANGSQNPEGDHSPPEEPGLAGTPDAR